MRKIFTLVAAMMLLLSGPVRSNATEPASGLPVVNNTAVNITAAEIELAYQATLARYRKVMPADLLARIERDKIKRIAIVAHTSRPDISDAGITLASVDLDSGEVDSVEIEVQPDYRLHGKQVSFEKIMEHEFAHAFAFLAGLPQAQQIGHNIEVEQLHF